MRVPATHHDQRLGQKRRLEDDEEGRADLLFLFTLLLAVLDPNGRFFHEKANVNASEGRQDAKPKEAAPTDQVEEQPIGEARKRKAEIPRSLQDTAHEPARASWP
jgi:hypothetical protein